jgi:3-hydroxyisobutyrate dehydrogenase
MQVAILGLGAMGSRMARRLLQSGHTVIVYNRSSPPLDELAAEGAVVRNTPRKAAEGAEIVIAMVRDNEASRAIWCDEQNGALKGLGHGTIVIESSTLTTQWVCELAAQVHPTGAAFLDAPVVGSRPQADAGQLIHLVGGETSTFDRARVILAVIGSSAYHVGAIGAGTTLKLVVNALFGAQVALLAESLALLRGSDYNLATMAEVLSSLPVTSPAAKGALALMLARSDAPLFPIDLVAKDFSYVLGQVPGTALPITTAVHECYAKAKRNGLASLNITAIARLYQPSGSSG